MEYFWKKRTIVGYYLSILVVLIHISTIFNYQFSEQRLVYDLYMAFDAVMRATFTRCAVPLFLIISGALFFRDYSNDKYLPKLKNRFRSLVLPFLLWNILSMLFEIMVTRSFLNQFLVGRAPFEFSVLNIFLSIFWTKNNSVFWFMFDLIVFVMAAPILWLFVKNKVVAWITALVLIGLNMANIGLPTSIFFKNDALTYFFVGAMIGRHYFSFFSQKKNRRTAMMALWIALLCTVLQIISGLEIVPISNPLNVPILIVYALTVWFATDLIIEKMPLANRYQNSFMMYALNQNVEAIIAKLLYLVMPKNQWFAFPNFILTVVMTVLAINMASQLLRRFMPPAYKLLTGGR